MKLSEKIQEALREQQEINLSDPAVQKRLAAHWGYVPAGTQPAPSVPDGWIQRGMAELEAIRSRQDDDALLDDRTLIERIGKAMLAAAKDAKP